MARFVLGLHASRRKVKKWVMPKNLVPKPRQKTPKQNNTGVPTFTKYTCRSVTIKIHALAAAATRSCSEEGKA